MGRDRRNEKAGTAWPQHNFSDHAVHSSAHESSSSSDRCNRCNRFSSKNLPAIVGCHRASIRRSTSGAALILAAVVLATCRADEGAGTGSTDVPSAKAGVGERGREGGVLEVGSEEQEAFEGIFKGAEDNHDLIESVDVRQGVDDWTPSQVTHVRLFDLESKHCALLVSQLAQTHACSNRWRIGYKKKVSLPGTMSHIWHR